MDQLSEGKDEVSDASDVDPPTPMDNNDFLNVQDLREGPFVFAASELLL